MKIGKVILRLREAKGLSQKQFRNLTGIQDIDKIETDEREPILSELESVAKALNTTVNDLCVEYILDGYKGTPEQRKKLIQAKNALNALIGNN